VKISAAEYEQLLKDAGKLGGKTPKATLQNAIQGFLASNAGKQLLKKMEESPDDLSAAASQKSKNAMPDLGGGAEGKALREAAKTGDAGGVAKLLDGKLSPDAAEFPSGLTPLMLAAAADQVEVVGMLIKAGAELDRVDIGGLSALHKAAQSGAARAVTSLLDGGADVTLRTPERVGAVTVLHWAASSGSTATIDALLDKGADINGKDGRGFTALHVAAAKGSNLAVSHLLKQGADAKSKNAEGLTPKDIAKISLGPDSELLSLFS